MKLEDLIGQACKVLRVDSEGSSQIGRVDRVNPELPFPIHVSWPGGGAWFLAAELAPSRLVL